MSGHRSEDIAAVERSADGGQRISCLSDSYAAGGGLLAIAGSHGYLEIALTNGSAARRLGAAIGTGVTVTTVD